MDFQRARTKEQIQNRQHEIINACETLYDKGGYELVNFKAISEITSFARPSIYNYYKTKDEILLDLLSRELLKWANTLNESVSRASSTKSPKESLAIMITDSLIAHEKMLKLMSILFTLLEINSSLEKLTEFKKDIMIIYSVMGNTLNQMLPNISQERIALFVTEFNALILGLYPMAHMTDKQKAAIEAAKVNYIEPDFKMICLDAIKKLLCDL